MNGSNMNVATLNTDVAKCYDLQDTYTVWNGEGECPTVNLCREHYWPEDMLFRDVADLFEYIEDAPDGTCEECRRQGL